MTYPEALEYLYTATPVFQHIGSEAYKPGLDNVLSLSEHYGHPERGLRCIHVGGTNGKGSTSHVIAAALQLSGLKVGLFTSPHLVDFRERIRINGEMISRERVCHFVEEARDIVERLRPSFFELTTMMALSYFASERVDVAVIEVGMGGRLDSTNIIEPVLSIITNVSLDHTQFLGHTLEAIAREKAGIIKEGVPVVVGDVASEAVEAVYRTKAKSVHAPLIVASRGGEILSWERTHEPSDGFTTGLRYETRHWGQISSPLSGDAQRENAETILTALNLLPEGIRPSRDAVQEAFVRYKELTGLRGRWETLSTCPRVICDTGHNEAGIRFISEQLRRECPRLEGLHIVLGVARDKDARGMLSLLPQGAKYYFCRASVVRSKPAEELRREAEAYYLEGDAYETIELAYQAAKKCASDEDLIFVGGSNFVVADLLVLPEFV